MESEERVFYNPYLLKECKGELESEGILLPPLVVKSNTRRRISEWKRKVVIAGIIFSTVVVLVVAGVIFDLSLYSDEPNSNSESAYAFGGTEMEKQTKLELNFQSDLHRVYDKIIHENTPEVLKYMFDYYKFEMSQVRDVNDLREYLVLLRSEGLLKVPYNLTQDDVLYALRITKNLGAWYSYLNNLADNLKAYETQKNILANKFEIDPEISMDIPQTRELDKVLKHYTKPVTTVVTGSRTVFKANIVLLSHILHMLQTDVKLKKSEVFIFATDIIYMDTDVIFPQTSLAIIAPTWSFLKNVSVFISGLNAAEHERDTAIVDKQGLPGNRGGNGGLFIGAGNFNADHLHVYTDGGNGGDGQNGSDGRNGCETAPPDYEEPQPYSCRKHLQDMINTYGEVISYYTVYDSFGCGKNGTDGGSPGQGGTGGNIVIMDTEKGVITFESGNRGSDGKAGKGGKGGRGASTGCYFHAHGDRRGKMHQITTRVCGTSMPSGLDGRDGYNIDAGEDTRANLTFFTESLKNFRVFALEEYANGNKKILDFIRQLDDLPYYSNLSSTQDFISELEMVDKFGNDGFYESIHNRIQKAWKLSNSRDLTYLRALSYGKLLNHKHRLDRYIIVDLDIFLETVLNDLEDIGWGSLTYKDHTLPMLTELLKEKVDYLNDSLDRWTDKTTKMLSSFDVYAKELTKKIDAKKMIYLTLMATKVLKPDRLLEHTHGKLNKYTFPHLDTSLSKTFNLRFSRHQELVLRELKAICTGDGILRTRLNNVKKLMRILNDLADTESELSDFVFDLEYFEITAETAEIVDEKRNFESYLSEVARMVKTDGTVDEYHREYLLHTLVLSRYKDALNVFRQWVFPHMHAYDQFLTKGNLTVDVALSNINLLRKWIKEYKSTITSYDKYIREAVFSSKNSVGEYYKWHNNEIRAEIIELFNGRRIHLTSSVENAHIFTKNAIKFRTVRIEFLSANSRLSKLLKNVQVDMRHSGYSYYYYNRQLYIQNGEGFDLRYSYELDGKEEPVNCNMIYKKLMNSPPVFSPYTTWTIQLKNIPDELSKVASDVDVALVGSGSYIDITDYTV